MYTYDNIRCKPSSVSDNITMSSAYSKQLILFPSIFTPELSEFKPSTRSFIYKANKVGDKESPCLTPESVLNQSVY